MALTPLCLQCNPNSKSYQILTSEKIIMSNLSNNTLFLFWLKFWLKFHGGCRHDRKSVNPQLFFHRTLLLRAPRKHTLREERSVNQTITNWENLLWPNPSFSWAPLGKGPIFSSPTIFFYWTFVSNTCTTYWLLEKWNSS